MRTWLGSIVFVILGSFALASGCGTPEVIIHDNGPDPGLGGATSSGGSGTGANGGNFTPIGDAGDTGMDCPSTCDQLGANCGYVSDTRCGGLIQCGDSCPPGQICGGDGPSRCGEGTNGDGGACSGPSCTCVPKTCDDLGYTCGPAGDTCGNKLDCGSSTCPVLGWTCGGGSQPGQCGCTGECSKVPDCSQQASKTTTLTGKVYDPAGRNPLYHVFVYVANNPNDPDLKGFPAGVSCDVCGATAAGSPLLSEGNQFGTYTDVDGTFTLKNVPVDKAVTVVIQLGRWRRVFTMDIDKPCAENAVPDKTLLMPSKQSEGNIPLMAMVTGQSDSLECVLRKMGIDRGEFTNPAGGGRVQFYRGSDKDKSTAVYGQKIDNATPAQDALFTADATGQPKINDYDMTILACVGVENTQSTADMKTLRNYAADGGRVFTTHFSYSWLTKNDDDTTQKGKSDNWSEVAVWNRDRGDQTDGDTAVTTGHIDLVSNPKGKAFQGWLEAVNASVPNSGTTDVLVVRHDSDSISSVPGQTQQWLYRDGGKVGTNDYTGKHLPLHFTYNTPVNLVEDLKATPPALQCGRVLFSDFHVRDVTPQVEHDKVFPSQCGKACTKDSDCATGGTCVDSVCLDPMNAQEKLLEFMIFDLGSCVPPPKECVPAGKCPTGADCGYVPDGCGGLISCGECPTGEACGVGTPPVPNKCGKGGMCVPQTCAAQKKECGPAADGCGDKIDSCGTCAAGELCVDSKCVKIN